MKDRDYSEKTRIVHFGRDHTDAPRKAVNPPVVRGSTVLYQDCQTLRETRAMDETGERVFRYGARGTPTTFQLEAAITDIERGTGTLLFPTGLAAVAHPMLSLLRPGDHALFGDTIYGPARALATEFFPQRGVECEFYAGGADAVAERLRPNTKMVYIDNPGSIIFDIQDIPAIAKQLEGRETYLVVDNTWGAPALHRPIELGADVSLVAITKYIAGHSDILMGSVTANARCFEAMRKDSYLLGQTVSPDDAYQALRGLRTAATRFAAHEATAHKVIALLKQQPLVAKTFYPPDPADDHHALWKRDFSGGNGLLSFAFEDGITQEQVDRFVDALDLFGIGASWGGYESLVMIYGKVPGWDGGRVVRLHVGLEDAGDLMADLAQAFAVIG
jgi:cystathionine beta-lyase